VVEPPFSYDPKAPFRDRSFVDRSFDDET
jgi:hypothetical protein